MGGLNLFRKKCIMQILPDMVIDNEFTKKLEKGDVILYRRSLKNFMNALICAFTRSPYSHVELYLGHGWTVSADPQGVTFSKALHGEMVDVMRPKKALKDAQVDILIGKAYQSVGKPYEYLGLFGFPWGREKRAIKRSSNQAYICSELVSWCYSKAGIDLVPGRPESIEAPADLAHSDKLKYIGSFDCGSEITLKFNEPHESQGVMNRFAQFLVDKIGDPTSKRNEWYDELRKKQQEVMGEA